MPTTVHRVVIWYRLVGTVESVSYEIISEADQTARPEAAAKCRVLVVDLYVPDQLRRCLLGQARLTYASVDDSDLDSLARDALLP